MNAPGTAKRTTFLSANSFDALKFCGMPQDVRSEASGVHGTYLQPISQPCDVRTLEDVLVRLRAYEKITPSGNESPALRPDIVKSRMELTEATATMLHGYQEHQSIMGSQKSS